MRPSLKTIFVGSDHVPEWFKSFFLADGCVRTHVPYTAAKEFFDLCPMDAEAGKVLDAFENSPHSNNTIVVFWSDHGQQLGEKRHWRKQAVWEESTRLRFELVSSRKWRYPARHPSI